MFEQLPKGCKYAFKSFLRTGENVPWLWKACRSENLSDASHFNLARMGCCNFPNCQWLILHTGFLSIPSFQLSHFPYSFLCSINSGVLKGFLQKWVWPCAWMSCIIPFTLPLYISLLYFNSAASYVVAMSAFPHIQS